MTMRIHNSNMIKKIKKTPQLTKQQVKMIERQYEPLRRQFKKVMSDYLEGNGCQCGDAAVPAYALRIYTFVDKNDGSITFSISGLGNYGEVARMCVPEWMSYDVTIAQAKRFIKEESF